LRDACEQISILSKSIWFREISAMSVLTLRGVPLVHEILGQHGPFVAISPGGRRGMESDRALGTLIAEAGFRVLIYDRRNTGASGIAIEGRNESLEQARDLLALLEALGTGPAYIAGCSSGARLSLMLALHHPQAVKALLLWRVTGGPYAAKRLAFNYYEQYIAAAEAGGIDAVCATEHFAAMVAANPATRASLDRLGRDGFIAGMRTWLEGFRESCDHPVAGLSPAELRGIATPALIIPGNDRVHPRLGGQAAHRLMPRACYHDILTQDVDLDIDLPGWEANTGRLASVFIDFLRAREAAA
jgi:pimeloyl-ACP methyl ester carboxylesterase